MDIAAHMLLVVAATLATQSPQALPVELRWDAPASCYDQGEAQATVRRWIGEGEPSYPQQEPAARATVTVVPTPDGYTARLEIETTADTSYRELAGPDCTTLSNAAALVVALAIDPIAAGEQYAVVLPESASQPVVATSSVASTRTPSPTDARPDAIQPVATTSPVAPGAVEPVVRSATRRPWHLRGTARLSVGLGGGMLPRPGPVVRVGAGLVARGFRLESRASAWLPQRANVTAVPGGAIELWIWTIGVRACAVPGAGKVTFPICVGVDGGSMRGKGSGLAGARTETRPAVAIPFSIALSYALSRRVVLWIEGRGGHCGVSTPIRRGRRRPRPRRGARKLQWHPRFGGAFSLMDRQPRAE